MEEMLTDGMIAVGGQRQGEDEADQPFGTGGSFRGRLRSGRKGLIK